MGIFDSIFGKKSDEALELERLKKEIEDSQRTLQWLKNQVEHEEKIFDETVNKRGFLLEEIKSDALKAAESELEEINSKIAHSKNELEKIESAFEVKKSAIIELDEKILLQEFALYEPMYDFTTSEQYKVKLDEIREQQKIMLKDGTAAFGGDNWLVNGSATKGRKMVQDTQKLLLRAFNGECEFVTWKVKYNNFDSCKKRIENAYTAIQKLGRTTYIEISREYYELKIQELHLALEYQQMKQREKDRQRELREQQKEEAALQKEIEETRRKIQKEQSHYLNALATAKKQLINTSDENERHALEEKISELEGQVDEIEKNLADIDYREINQRAGYVYIISNVGSFGENVFKIGMTRRLDPMERINELGGASVPFNFDVHAMIFSDDAPKLEATLHRAFENEKLNMVNTRREFFRVRIEEIEKIVKANYDKSVEFIRTADAEQFRESEKMRERNRRFLPVNNNRHSVQNV